MVKGCGLRVSAKEDKTLFADHRGVRGQRKKVETISPATIRVKETLKASQGDAVGTLSNLSAGHVEYSKNARAHQRFKQIRPRRESSHRRG